MSHFELLCQKGKDVFVKLAVFDFSYFVSVFVDYIDDLETIQDFIKGKMFTRDDIMLFAAKVSLKENCSVVYGKSNSQLMRIICRFGTLFIYFLSQFFAELIQPTIRRNPKQRRVMGRKQKRLFSRLEKRA